MRPIKFRAWDKVQDAMVNFDIYNVPPYVGQTHLEGEKFERKYEIMQYTGLKDKNGTEIYEGDILYVDQIGTVDRYLPNKKNIGVRYDESDTSFVYDEDNGMVIGLFTLQDELKIVGNIYENPELLEVSS